MNSKLYGLIGMQNIHGMELREGGSDGGRGDDIDEGVVYGMHAYRLSPLLGHVLTQITPPMPNSV